MSMMSEAAGARPVASGAAAGAPAWQDALVGILLIVSTVTVVSALLIAMAARAPRPR